MSKNPKNKPGIHLLKRVVYIEDIKKNKSWFWWRIVASNGRTIARSTETYSRKANAIKSLKAAASILGKLSKGQYRDQTNPSKPLLRTLSFILPLLFLASCSPSRYMECPKSVTVADTRPVAWAYWKDVKVEYITVDTGQSFYELYGRRSTHDTVPEWMHVSRYPKGFVIVQTALSVRDNGYCIAHLDCDKKPFPVHYRVGWCEGKEQLLNRLVKGRVR